MKITRATIQKIIEEERFNLMERITDEVYRYLSGNELLKTLKNDKFYMTAAVGSEAEVDLISKGKFYYLSTTRGRGGDYHQRPSAWNALIKLDGRKLGQRYSGKPVDYWSSGQRSERGSGRSEAEDRIYSDKPFIPKASQYIKEIHFLIKDSKSPKDVYGDLNGVRKQSMRDIMMLAKRKNIKIYFYNTIKNFILMNPKNALKIDLEAFKRNVDDIKDKGYQQIPKSADRSEFASYIELFHKNSRKSLSKNADKKIYDLMYSNWGNDQQTVLASYIHNNRQLRDATDGKRMAALLKLMQKHKLKTPTDVVEFLTDKWEKITKAEEDKK